MRANFKKIVLVTFLLLSITFKVSAPFCNSIILVDCRPIEPYISLMLAIGMVETKGDTLAYNPLEEAAGYFQIRPIRLLDYNNRTGSNYTMKDLFNYKISEKIFLYFADQIGPYNLEQIARRWNGSGHLTSNYWERIKEHL